METKFTGDVFSLEVRRDVQTFWTSGHHVLDPKWKTTDESGHVHSSLDLLEWVVTGTYWCDSCHDEHEEGEYRCRLCGEVVEPSYVWTGEESFTVPGLTDVILRMDDGRSFFLRGEETTVEWPPSAEWLAKVTSREPDEFSPVFQR